MHGLHILYTMVVGCVVGGAIAREDPQLIFGTIMLAVFGMAMRWEGMASMGRKVRLQVVEANRQLDEEEYASGDKNDEGGSDEPGSDEV